MQHYIVVIAVLSLVLIGCGTQTADPAGVNVTRPFLMGTTQWPPAADLQAISEMHQIKEEHNDLSVFAQVAGVPWTDIANGHGVPKRVADEWRAARAKPGQKMFVALTPLNVGRTGIADLATQSADHVPLPAPWNTIALNDSRVKDAYYKYVRTAIGEMDPDYLAIGIEVNILASNDEKLFAEYVDLNRDVYRRIKAEYPSLPVFVTIQNEHLIGVISESRGKTALHADAVRTLMQDSDILGLSIYPYGPWIRGVPDETYLSAAADLAAQTGRPLAISETGYPSRQFTAFGVAFDGSVQSQQQYIEMLLSYAGRNDMPFVVNWVTQDYERLLEVIPVSQQDASLYWAYTGLVYANGTLKPAMSSWDAWHDIPYSVS